MRPRYMLHVQRTPAGYAGLIMLNGRTLAATARRFADRNTAIRAAFALCGAL